MNPSIDEAWEHLGNHRVIIKNDRLTEIQVLGGGRPKESADRARIAACAPEALRMLLELEWVSQEGDEGALPDSCPTCEAPRWRVSENLHDAHYDNCAWLLLMKKAGLR